MRNWSIRAMACSLAFTVLFSVSCSKDDGNPTGPGDDVVTSEWETGDPSAYTVSGSGTVSVSDSLSGAEFVVTPGSGATLTVSRITVGPELPFAGERFHVEYTGDSSMTLRIPADPDGGDTFLMSYSALEGASVDDMQGNVAWWSVPHYSEEDGVLEYGVTLEPAVSSKAAAGGAGNAGSNNYAIVRVGKGSGDFNHLRTIHQTVQQVIDRWLDQLPSSSRAALQARIDDLERTVMWTSGGNAYKHVTGFFSPRVILFFNTDAGLASIAHETGHYICHAIMGDDRYNDLYGRFPTDFWGTAVEHDLGAYRAGRKEILEDYPYVSMILNTGDLVQYDLTSVAKYNNVRDMTNNADPSAVDYPSHEAFGAAMLASLLRTDDTIYSFSRVKGWETAKVPVVGASWGDVLEILGRGPRDQNELRSYIQDYLDTRSGDRYKLSAMMEPLGWSYNGEGTIVDQDGKPFPGAYAQNIMQDGDNEYRTTASATTDADGEFTLPRIYPGSSILRVFYITDAGQDSTDFALTVEWSAPTNETRKLGEFALERQQKNFELEFEGSYLLTPGIRAQNQLKISGTGYLTGPENMIVVPQFSSGVLDIQSIIGLNQEATVDMTLTYELTKGTTWITSLSAGDYEDAVKAETSLSHPQFKLYEAFGPNETRTERYMNPPNLLYYIAAATATGQYYRADIRLEWDFVQTYYDKDGGVVGSDSGKTGVYFLHVWRDVSASL